jgi:hypothetical protein
MREIQWFNCHYSALEKEGTRLRIARYDHATGRGSVSEDSM